MFVLVKLAKQTYIFQPRNYFQFILNILETYNHFKNIF